jgi:hypothetical protein
MRRPTCKATLVCLFVLFISGCCHQQPNPNAEISVAQIESRGVIGSLGEPIGTVVNLYTQLIPENDKGENVDARVNTVGNRVLPATVSIRLALHPNASKEIKLPDVGQPVVLTGYETCFYTGTPDEIMRKTGISIQTTGYYFVSVFVVLDVQKESFASSQRSTRVARGNLISIVDISANGIVGQLGERLGTVMKISGLIASQSYDSVSERWKTWATVDRIDDRALSSPVGIKLFEWFISDPESDKSDVAKRKPGERFTYLGYETGGFVGTPRDALNYVLPSHRIGQHFETWFEVWPSDSTKDKN